MPPMLAMSRAAVRSGFSIELLRWLARECPKRGESRLLPVVVDEFGVERIDKDELDRYLAWLREPWPRTLSGGRPHIPKAIAYDVKQECHHECAICGRTEHGELAHIDPLAETLNNSPDNLIELCPNHHTAYDLGYKPAANLAREDVVAAKATKRRTRARVLLHEDNVVALLDEVVRHVHVLQRDLQAAGADTTRYQTYATELKSLMSGLPGLIRRAQEAAAQDRSIAADAAGLLAAAPTIRALTEVAPEASRPTEIVAREVVEATRHLVKLDETECPHCNGRGLTGLMGRLCKYCGGDQYVSAAKVRKYDRDAIDEETCPHCDGRGTTGLMSRVCEYCGGDQVVSRHRAAEYTPDAVDEVPCPHCEGRGTTGLMNRVCPFCDGDQRVSAARADGYEEAQIGDVPCPHCDGRGTIGLTGTVCRYCGGDQDVSGERAASYDPDEIDEVPCPRCGGAGEIGFGGTVCPLCSGDTVVSAATASRYDGPHASTDDW